MTAVADVLQFIDQIAPWSMALPQDKVGLQVGDPTALVTKALVSLDRSEELLSHAAAIGAELVVCHHPLIWNPITSLTTSDAITNSIEILLGSKISFIAAHTNWDAAKDGISETMANLLGLESLEPFGQVAHSGSLPLGHYPLGRIGTLSAPMSLTDFAKTVDRLFETRSQTWGDPSSTVRRVAVMGGTAGSSWPAALAAGADAFLTGEVAQHDGLAASRSGMAIMAAGHYATEHPGCETLRQKLADRFPDVEWHLFVPEPGLAGRPF